MIETEYKRNFVIPSDHPALAGHFPGNPIVPGVVILDSVFNACESVCRTAVKEIQQAKFLNVLKADIECNILFQPHKDSMLRFTVYGNADQKTYATGIIKYG